MDKKKHNEKIKKRQWLNQAFQELQQETGIDHAKLLAGDKKEKKKLTFRQYQEKMRIDQDEE